MELLLPERFEGAATAYGYQRVIFEQVAAGERPPTVSITPSTRHVGVTRRDTFRAVEAGFKPASTSYGAVRVPLDGPTLALARGSGGPHMVGA